MTERHTPGDPDRQDHDNVVMWGDPDDDLAQLLRSELGREAASITPSDRFAEILAATDEEEQGHSPWRWIGVAAALLLLAGVIAPVLVNRQSSQSPAATPTSQSAVATTSSDTIQTQQLHLPVYFVNSQSHLFYQESRNLPTLNNPLITAVNAVLNVAPNNGQYTSLWKGGTVLSATVKNNVAYVNLSSDAYAQAFTNKTDATNAAFQIYYTVNAVLSDNTNPINVVLQDEGKTTVPVLGNTLATDFWANPPSLGPVYVDSPQSGDTVAAGQVTITGYILTGNSAPRVSVAHADGTSSRTGTATLVGGGSQQWQKWSFTTTLTKGEFQVTVAALDSTNTVLFTVQ